MKYKTVVIDPPWPIDSVGDVKNISESEIRNQYRSMSLEEIKEFPINDFADDSCYLFLWVTNSRAMNIPVLYFGFDLVELWGFKYHKLITWSKSQGFSCWSPLRNVTEHCIFAFRGKLDQSKQYMKNHIHTTNQIKHSQKPAQFYQKLREWTPEPRIDIFARNSHYGFDGWGDEYVGEGLLQEFLE